MLMTANPHYDAECWENEQEHRAATAEAREIEAGRIVLAEMKKLLTPTKWWAADISGPRPFTLDEILYDALECDDDTKSAFAELMTSDAAKKVLDLMASYHAKRYWRDIAGLPDDERDDV